MAQMIVNVEANARSWTAELEDSHVHGPGVSMVIDKIETEEQFHVRRHSQPRWVS